MRARDFSISASTTTQSVTTKTLKLKYKQLEFKYLYFRIQALINKRVTLSLRYEQFKTPEIHSSLVKPISEKIVKLLGNQAIAKKLQKIIQTPRYGNTKSSSDVDVSSSLIFILFLLKYEYLIQSENNLILFELLSTKANLCELLAIRMLKVYQSFDRINVLFQAPLFNDNFDTDQRYSFNTLELSVLSKSKKFLSQPIIIRIMDRFYNGELILKPNRDQDNHFMDLKGKTLAEAEELIGDCIDQRDVINYQFRKITISKIIQRSNIVPKYQALVLNLKVLCFMLLYFTLILNPKETGQTDILTYVEVLFWLVGFNFNLEFFLRIFNVEFVFFKKIIWNYMDAILIILIDMSLALKFLKPIYFRDAFSLISIILLPRSLSVFNNYQFFNLITLLLKKMLWNLMGLCCLFFALISGFYFSFITLSKKTHSNSEIMFDMVKVFFGFTPSVWNNWDNYNTLGKIIQMGYLFLIQFIIGSILAIVLSGVFAKINQNNHEEFNYIKTINMIVFFKSSSNLKSPSNNNKIYLSLYRINYRVLMILVSVLNIFKIPLILSIFIYEKMVSSFYKEKVAMGNELKFYTFFRKDKDYDQDQDLKLLDRKEMVANNIFLNTKSPINQPLTITPSHDFGLLDLGFDSEYAVFDDEDDYEDEIYEDDNVSAKKSRRYSHLDANIRKATKKMKSIHTLRASKNYTNSSDSLYGDDKRIPMSLSYQSHALTNYPKVKKDMPDVKEETRQNSGSTVVENTESEILNRIKRLEQLILSKLAPELAYSDELIRSECDIAETTSIIFKGDDTDKTIPFTDEDELIHSEFFEE